VKGQVSQRVEAGKQQLREKGGELGAKVRTVTPEQAQETAGRAVRRTRERPLPAAVIGALLAGFAIGRLTSGR
jgi:hypothetical protein